MQGLLEPRGYRAMIVFLRSRYTGEHPGTIKTILEDLESISNGSPTASVQEDWNAAVQSAYSSGSEPFTQLHLG